MADGRFAQNLRRFSCTAEDSSLLTQETWKAMEEIYKKGLARAIGVSNYSVKKTKDLLQYGSVVPAVNQVSSGSETSQMLEH